MKTVTFRPSVFRSLFRLILPILALCAAVGCGIAYGYAWALSRHFNLELEVGLGYIYTEYDRYECGGCGRKAESNVPYHYFGPTKAALNIMYVF